MLKRLYIDNFRCFVNFEYKPERKQLLLGANGSGKSSLLDAVRAVQGFVCEDGGGDFSRTVFQDSKTRWLNLPKQVFEIEAELEGKQYIYRLEINAEGDSKDMVLAESLKVEGNPILEYSNGKLSLFTENPVDPVAELGVRINGGYSILGFLSDFRTEAKKFVIWLSKDLFFFRINPYAMKNTGKFTGPVRPAIDLNNIADWYMSLTLHDSHGMFQLRSSLQEVFDGLASLNFKYTETGYADLIVSFNRPKDSLTFRLMELSEGQRCLIALYMILHFLVAKGCTVFLDEPDNFISLREIQPWLLAAEQAVEDSKGQLILISHHPEILNQWSQEYGLRFFREENGHVRTEKFKTDYDGVLQPSEIVARGWENE
jgi:energy-coupling factor transporter ATP-binding protein EcfA2